MKSINDWAKEIHALAVQKGWWDKPREIPELLMNCTTELGEAMQEHKNGKAYLYYICENTGEKCEECFLYDTHGHLCPSMLKKPEGIAVEMVDCIIWLLDWMHHEGVDIEDILERKHSYNSTRSYRHGGKIC